MKKKVVVANWKMNKTFTEADTLLDELALQMQAITFENVSVILAPPFPFLPLASKKFESFKKVFISAQNCHQESSGAYTGEVSAGMIKSVGVDYVIIGHSERRLYFKEDTKLLKSKIELAIKSDLIPIFCVGETLDQRKTSSHFDVIESQISEVLFSLPSLSFSKIILAYEPVWAIGTGQTASSSEAQEMHHFIRSIVTEKYGLKLGDGLTILYGGSCNEMNANELFSCKDINGGLIGGASLNSSSFIKIIRAAEYN